MKLYLPQSVCTRVMAYTAALTGSVFCFFAQAAFAQFNPEVLENSVVRVIVGAGTSNSRAASGFVWEDNRLVVTSLHAVPAGLDIVVKCKGASFPARVAGVLSDADLILLQTDSPTSCIPLNQGQMSSQKPGFGEALYTLGYFESSQAMTSRDMTKQHASPEVLRHLAQGEALQLLKKYGIPDLDLDIYYVQGGLLPGYSGAPVVDRDNRLVGIVDGGLNKGMSNYNWVIPATNLNRLTGKMQAGDTAIPPEVAIMQGILFSSPSANTGDVDVIAFSQNDRDFRFIQTKTSSLLELALTSDDPEGIVSLLNSYANAVGLSEDQYYEMADRLKFDIYEDERLGLIIAVPAAQGLSFEELQPGYEFLISETETPGDGFVQFEVFEEGLAPAGSDWFGYGDPEYLDKLIQGLIADCADWGNECELDNNSVRALTFADGTMIFKVGLFVNSPEPDTIDPYDYYSFAINEDLIFRAYGRIHPSDDGLRRCNDTITCTSDPEVALVQLTQLLGVHLTTFREVQN